jgi:hypothetical protein
MPLGPKLYWVVRIRLAVALMTLYLKAGQNSAHHCNESPRENVPDNRRAIEEAGPQDNGVAEEDEGTVNLCPESRESGVALAVKCNLVEKAVLLALEGDVAEVRGGLNDVHLGFVLFANVIFGVDGMGGLTVLVEFTRRADVVGLLHEEEGEDEDRAELDGSEPEDPDVTEVDGRVLLSAQVPVWHNLPLPKWERGSWNRREQ